ncbi:hypothetical protein R3Q06_33380 [Rhodococcus erythropolis]|uniref:hypothetical protein n=1 Tax=Rhodococcus erythropolis TaxID=1833 RepID=UPI002949D409|nr:hypothetical protein [Rhodococcus erythropolis]MDV6278333.1 hypothetical protein [Rhodococcus erythropolis]
MSDSDDSNFVLGEVVAGDGITKRQRCEVASVVDDRVHGRDMDAITVDALGEVVGVERYDPRSGRHEQAFVSGQLTIVVGQLPMPSHGSRRCGALRRR